MKYEHRFFGGFSNQRARFLAAEEYAEIPLVAPIQAQLDSLVADLSSTDSSLPVTTTELWLHSVRALRPFLLWSIAANIFVSVMLLISVFASKQVLESLSLASALAFAGAFLVAEMTSNVVRYFEFNRRHQLYRALQISLFTVVNRKLLRIDPHLTGDLSKGNIKTIISSDLESVEDFFGGLVSILLPALIVGSVLAVAVYVVAGTLGIIGMAVAVLQIPIAIIFAHRIARYQQRVQKAQDKLITLIGEWVRNIRLVRYLGWQQAINRDVEAAVHGFTVDAARRHLFHCATYAVSHGWWMIPIAAMLIAAYLLGQKLDLSSFFVSIWIMGYFTNQIQYIPYPVSTFGPAATGMRRVAALMSAPEILSAVRITGKERAQGVPHTVTLREVSVVFGSHAVLGPVSMTIDLRSRTAIVGSVGSGKSTLLELLCGERAPSQGSIEVEFSSGERGDLWDDWVYHSYRRSIAYSSQQPFLSNTTVRLNMDLGGRRTLEEIQKAAEQSALLTDIELFANSFEEEVGETGINLSGGQKQRVSLARAFLSGRPILLLDDPLSAVDAKTEKHLMREIARGEQGLVLVSHRLEELHHCGRTITLERGRVVEDGVTTTLLKDPDSRLSQFVRVSAERDLTSNREGAS